MMPPNKARLPLRWDAKTATRFHRPNSQRYWALGWAATKGTN